MKKTFADLCLERAKKATEAPWVGDEFEMVAPNAPVMTPGFKKIVWADDYHMNEWDAEFIAFARTALPELAQRLKKACELLREQDCDYFCNPKKKAHKECEFHQSVDELEAVPVEKV